MKVHVAREDISMTPDEVAGLLNEARHLQVATNGSDGFPHLTTLWFVVDGGLITFRSFTKSQRIVNLERDPRLTVLAETGETYATLRGVMIQGRARLSRDRFDVLRVYAEVAKKMEGLDEIDPMAVETLFGRYAAKNTVVSVDPVRVISWDHRKLDGY